MSEFSLLVLFVGDLSVNILLSQPGLISPACCEKLEVKKIFLALQHLCHIEGAALMRSHEISKYPSEAAGFTGNRCQITHNQKKVGLVRKCAYASRDAQPPARAFGR